jgi:glycosyltransferase involved in cell wall biosynthesis
MTTQSLTNNVPPSPTDLPTFSIITPSYNQAQFIRHTIESVLSQSYSKIEYWVIDGGSTDQTVSILKEYERDPRFHWLSERDSGQSNAINKGIAKCTGEIFAWLNSDDVYMPGTFNKVAQAWINHSNHGLFYGRARLIDEQGNDLGVCPCQTPFMTLDAILSTSKILMQPAVFMPTQTIKELKGVDESLHYGMDFDLWVRMAQRLPIIHIPEELAQFRMHTTSKSVSLSKKFVADVNTVLMRAANKGLITHKEADCNTAMFASRIYLAPETRNLREGIRNLKAAVLLRPSVFPEAILVLSKAMARLMLGEHGWSNIRNLSAKFQFRSLHKGLRP